MSAASACILQVLSTCCLEISVACCVSALMSWVESLLSQLLITKDLVVKAANLLDLQDVGLQLSLCILHQNTLCSHHLGLIGDAAMSMMRLLSPLPICPPKSWIIASQTLTIRISQGSHAYWEPSCVTPFSMSVSHQCFAANHVQHIHSMCSTCHVQHMRALCYSWQEPEVG